MDPNLLSTLAIVLVMIIAFQFMIVRPAKAKAEAQQATVNAIQPGTRVMTTAGIYGNVRHIGTSQAILEIAPGIEMTVAKQAISKVVTPDEDEFEYADDDVSAESGDDELAAERAADDGFASATDEIQPDADGQFRPYQGPDGDAKK